MSGHLLGRLLAVKGNPLRGEAHDLRNETGNVIVRTKSSVRACGNPFREVRQPAAELTDAVVFFRHEPNRSDSCLVEKVPEFIARSAVVMAALGRFRADGGAAENDVKIGTKVVGQNWHVGSDSISRGL